MAPIEATPSMRENSEAWTLVWIDSRRATLLTWVDGEVAIHRMESEVPAHRSSTGHVRHDPAVRHGGGGEPQTAGDPHRQEHLNRFIEEVAGRLSDATDVEILGPEEMRGRLARHITESDRHHGRGRKVVAESSAPMTDRQLSARLRDLVGKPPLRRTVGAWRWTGQQPHRASGSVKPPRRTADKRRDIEDEAARGEAADAAAEEAGGQ